MMPESPISEKTRLSIEDFEVPAIEMVWAFRHRSFFLVYFLFATLSILFTEGALQGGGVYVFAAMAFGLGLLYVAPRSRARILLRRHVPDGGETRYSFDDKDMRVEIGGSVVQLAYSSITKAQEGTTAFILRAPSVGPMVVPKRIFPVQAINDLRALLQSKTVLKNARTSSFGRALRWIVTVMGVIFLGLLAYQIYVQRPR